MLYYTRSSQLDKTFNDEYLNSLPKDWNDLTKNSLDEILKIYRNYIKLKNG